MNSASAYVLGMISKKMKPAISYRPQVANCILHFKEVDQEGRSGSEKQKRASPHHPTWV